jgi:uncharacterized protein (TIGR02145 family)
MKAFFTISRILMACFMVFLPFSCKKAPELPSNTNKTTIPTITTSSVLNIHYNSIECGGLVSSDGGAPVTVRGVCWNNSGNPTFQNNLGFTSDSIGIGSFTSLVTGLEENTNYFITAYATNERGTAYGSVKAFTTLEIILPTVITSQVNYITNNSAQTGGEVTDDGNGTITMRGVCWNTAENPTLQNNIGYTIDGSGKGIFTSNLNNLSYLQQYFVAAYATNEEGTSYGEVISFIAQEPPCGQLTVNFGNQVYNTVQVGSQCWFKENLNIGVQINGNLEQTNNSTIEKYCYVDNEAYCTTYGGLYQWNEMMQYTTVEGTKGICPDGWHIPTKEELQILVDYLGGDGVAGGPMKEPGTAHWNPPNTGATNSSGFTALPGGNRSASGGFDNLGIYCYFWSSTQYDPTHAWKRKLYSDYDNVFLDYSPFQDYGFSVRCLRY